MLATFDKEVWGPQAREGWVGQQQVACKWKRYRKVRAATLSCMMATLWDALEGGQSVDIAEGEL